MLWLFLFRDPNPINLESLAQAQLNRLILLLKFEANLIHMNLIWKITARTCFVYLRQEIIRVNDYFNLIEVADGNNFGKLDLCVALLAEEKKL